MIPERYNDYYGDTTRWFVGRVVSIDDPKQLGRIQVRIYGIHSTNTLDIPDEDLEEDDDCVHVRVRRRFHLEEDYTVDEDSEDEDDEDDDDFDEEYDEEYINKYDLTLKKGWNIVYNSETESYENGRDVYSYTISKNKPSGVNYTWNFYGDDYAYKSASFALKSAKNSKSFSSKLKGNKKKQ